MPTQKQIAEAYQPLFDYMSEVYGKTLLVSEMSELMDRVNLVNENLEELFRAYCDVGGCQLITCNNGGCWRETGYWCVCQVHSAAHRNGESQPQMKKEAVEREASRLSDGTLPISEFDL